MNAIINNQQGAVGYRDLFLLKQGRAASGDDVHGSAVRLPVLCRLLLPVIFCFLLLYVDISCPVSVFGANFEVTPVAEITTNSDGQNLKFPVAVFYDSGADETYVIDGAGGLVTVYAPNDFFPLATFSQGRGVITPLSGYVDPRKGFIYICQNPFKDKPARITVFNGAFMPVRQILFDDIPGVPNFIPTNVALNRDGLMYVVGRNVRGVAVLDSDGVFLRWLRPMDRLFLSAKEKAAMKGVPMKRVTSAGDEEPSSEASTGQPAEEKPDESTTEKPAKDNPNVNIPAQFRPKTKKEKEAEGGTFSVALKVTSVTIDKSGRLYVLCGETSKTYVYSPEETFLFSFGMKGGGPRMLSTPRGVAVDDERHLVYVVDFMRHEILVFNQKDGEFLFEFGGKGGGPGWFNYPNGIAVNRKGQVIVSDLFNHRVQVLDVKYQPEASLGEEPGKISSSTEAGGDEEKGAVEEGNIQGADESGAAPTEGKDKP